MVPRPTPVPALLRGAAVGTSTAALAAAAHASAGGALPSGVGTVLLALLGMTLGAVTTVLRHGDRFVVLVAVLTLGQAVAHAVLGVGGHHHGSGDPSSAGVMLGAHAIAVIVIATLIAVGDALCRAVSRAVRAATPRRSSPIRALTVPALRRCEHPMRASLLLAASWSYRGPPADAAR